MRLWITIIVLNLLTGCGIQSKLWMPPPTPEESAAIEKQATEERRIRAEELAKEQRARAEEALDRYRPMCTQFGFKEGTPDFGNCILRLYANDEANAATRSSGGTVIINSTAPLY